MKLFIAIIAILSLLFLVGCKPASICANESCALPQEDNVTINITEPVVPDETIPPVIFDTKISSFTCKWSVKEENGVKRDCVQIIAKGTAQGPVGARLELPISSWSTDKFTCEGWTLKPGALIAVGSTCKRMDGQPETANWTMISEGCPLKSYFDKSKVYTAKIYNDDDIEPQVSDRKETACQ